MVRGSGAIVELAEDRGARGGAGEEFQEFVVVEVDEDAGQRDSSRVRPVHILACCYSLHWRSLACSLALDTAGQIDGLVEGGAMRCSLPRRLTRKDL